VKKTSIFEKNIALFDWNDMGFENRTVAEVKGREDKLQNACAFRQDLVRFYELSLLNH
jgi:hypothetical protein